ncbi:MAG TPA: GNAT family N-acetyltransferase [Pseudomonadales bacterium]
MTPKPELVVAGPADEAALLPLVRAYHAFEEVELTDAQRRRALGPLLAPDSSFGRIWLVRSAGRTVGYAALCFGYSIEFAGRDAFLDELFIEEAARGRGIGRAVLELVQQQCAALGIGALHLEVARDNVRARRLYEALGFDGRERFHLMSWRADLD